MTNRSDQQIIDDYIRFKTGEGWQIVNRSESSVQFRKSKQVNRGWVVLGLITLPLGGIGLLVWGLALIDYLTQDDRVAFYTVDDIKSGVEFEEPEPYSILKIILIVIAIMIIILILVIVITNLFA